MLRVGGLYLNYVYDNNIGYSIFITNMQAH